MDTFKKKIMDLLGSALALFIPVMYWNATKKGSSAGYNKLRAGSAYIRLWSHYNLAVILRPWFWTLAGFVLATTVMMAPVWWYLAPDDVSWTPFWCWLAFNGALVIGIIVVHARLWAVGSVDHGDLDGYFADRARISARTDLTEVQRKKALEDRVVEFRKKHGPTHRLGLATAARLLTTIPLQAIGMLVFASAISAVGVSWAVSATYVLAALLLAGLSLAVALLVALVLGTTLRVVFSIALSLFKGGWDSVITMFPNIEGEEAKELLEKDLGKKLLQVWNLFTAAVLSAPGKAILGLLALFINWHHPLEIIFLTLAFIGLTFATGFEQVMGNKVEEKTARAGRIVSGFFVAGFLYRMAEMWRHGLGPSTWEWSYGDSRHELISLWAAIVPWWNGLVSTSWYWEAPVIVIVVSVSIYYLFKLPDGLWWKRIKYTFVTLCSMVIAVVVIGFVANMASVDAHVSMPAPADVQAGTEAPTVHPPDTIDRMAGGTATSNTPPVAVPVAPVVEPLPVQRVEAIAPSRDTPRRELTLEERCRVVSERALPQFRDSVRARLGC